MQGKTLLCPIHISEPIRCFVLTLNAPSPSIHLQNKIEKNCDESQSSGKIDCPVSYSDLFEHVFRFNCPNVILSLRVK